GYVGITTAPSGLAQSFANFKWNSPSQTAVVNLAGALTTINGDFTVADTGTGTLRLTGGSGFTLTVGGNFSCSNGILDMSSGSGVTTMNLSKDFPVTASGVLTESGTGTRTIVLLGSGPQNFSNSCSIQN